MLKEIFTRRRRYMELSESIREHLSEKIADLMDQGMTSVCGRIPSTPCAGCDRVLALRASLCLHWRSVSERIPVFSHC
jgi:hypothetical protein